LKDKDSSYTPLTAADTGPRLAVKLQKPLVGRFQESHS
jgi:hypothetical protein